MKIVLALTGASGQIYGVRILEELYERNIETHVIVSDAAKITLKVETDYSLEYLKSKSTKFYANEDIAAPMSSGSFSHDGMIIAPCSMKTASSIANCFTDNLIARAADVTLKEKRRLLLLVRETPLHAGHLEILLKLAKLGAIVMPPIPAFYTKPTTVDEIVYQVVARVLEKFGIKAECRRWEGL
jgi:4-hydroxy-3-polyprenylbenzoate decarboxylase